MKLKIWKSKLDRNDLIHYRTKYVYDFKKIQTIRYLLALFLIVSETDKKHSNLLEVILQFDDKVRRRSKTDMEKKRNAYESVNTLYEGRE